MGRYVGRKSLGSLCVKYFPLKRMISFYGCSAIVSDKMTCLVSMSFRLSMSYIELLWHGFNYSKTPPLVRYFLLVINERYCSNKGPVGSWLVRTEFN